MSRRAVFSLLLAAVLTGCAHRCFLKPDEQVNFFPGYAYQPPGQSDWTVVIHGQVVREDPNSLFSASTLKALNTFSMLMPDVGQTVQMLQERLRPFAVEGRADKAVPVEVGGKKQVLAKSNPDGFFEDAVQVPAPALIPAPTWLEFQAEPCREDPRHFSGQALVIPEKGLSVISDVDHTIKLSEGASRQDAVKDMLVKAYEPVPGMAQRYNLWAAQGALFHYISPSPWQLLQPLQDFLKANGFPLGTLHLQQLPLQQATRSFNGLLDLINGLIQSAVTYENPVIEDLLHRFPQRQFVLVGNSQEDPELYAALARQHPGQIHAIYIRALPGETPRPYEKIFEGLPKGIWKVFKKPEELE